MTFQRYCFVTFSIYVNHSAQSNVKLHKNTCDIKNWFDKLYLPPAYRAKKRVINVCICLHNVERVHYHIYFNELLVFMCKILSANVRNLHKRCANCKVVWLKIELWCCTFCAKFCNVQCGSNLHKFCSVNDVLSIN